MEILGYILMVLVSLLDPIMTPGYIISGWVIKNLAGALTASILWNLFLYVMIVAPQTASEQSSPRTDILVASWVGALLMTSLVFFFASRRRIRQQAETNPNKDNGENKPST